MNHFDVLKRAWEITWKYRILWLFGLFVGAGGGGGNSFNIGGQFPSGSTGDPGEPLPPFFEDWILWMEENLVLIAAALTVVVVLAVALWVLSIAARGALVYLVNEVQEGRPIRAGAGWTEGFRRWFRVFGIGFLVFAPLILLIVVSVGVFVAAAIGAGAGGGEGAAALTGFGAACCLLPIVVLLAIVFSFVLGILFELAIRHGILRDLGAVDSIRAAWSDLRSHFKDVFLIWLILLAIGIGYGVVNLALAAALSIPVVAAAFAEEWLIAAALTPLYLLLLVPAAILATLQSAVWTVFFRRLTGMEEVAPPPVYVPPAAQGVPPAEPRDAAPEGDLTAFPPPPPGR